MPLSYFGAASNPASSPGTGATSPVAVTPPASMAAGDLVILWGFTKTITAWTVSQAGGQTWNTIDANQIASTNRGLGIFWCIFNGTWSADPSLDTSVSQNITANMIVLRPSAGETVALSVDGGGQNGSAPTTPFDVTMTGITTLEADEAVLAIVASADDNIWAVQTGGWTNRLAVQNTSGTDAGTDTATMFKATAGATGDVVFRQTTNGGDVWIGRVFSFKTTAAGGDETAVLSPGALSLAGQTLANRLGAILTVGGLSLSGQALAAVTRSVLAPGGLSLAGQSPLVAIRATLTPASLTLQGQTVGTAVSVTSVLLPGGVTLQGQTLTGRIAAAATPGALALAGQTLQTSVAQVSTLTPGALSLQGQTVGVRVTSSLAPGALTLAGQTLQTRVGLNSTLVPGALSLQGQTALVRIGSAAAPGALSLQGQALVGRVTQRVTLTPGALALAGQAAALEVLAALLPADVTLAGQTLGIVLEGVEGPETRTYRGPKAGGAPSGQEETQTGQGPATGGAPSGALEVIGGRGP